MAAKTLRVAILGIKVPEARRYHVSVQVLAKGQAPAGVVALDGSTFDLRPDQVARTETTPLEANPMFLNRVFVMRLPESLKTCPSILLHCNLFATPSLGTSNAGAIVAGKEVDELIGAATLQIRGDVAARLLRGERCTLPAVLGSGASEDSGGVRDAIALASMFGARAAREVLLELMLLDANLTLPRDAPLLPAPTLSVSPSLGPGESLPLGLSIADASAGGGGLASAVAAAQANMNGVAANGGPMCKLQVLVVRAENLPTVRDLAGAEVAPDTFVSAASLREVRSRATPKSVTSTVSASQNPAWGQVLEVHYPEQELGDEQVCLGIVNDSNSRLMLKASIPLAPLVPRVHYNLKVTMPGGLLGSSVALYISLCLVDCPKLEHRQLQRAKPPLSHVLEARLAACSHQLGAIIKASNPPSSGVQYQEVFGVWSVVPSSHANTAEASSSGGNAEGGNSDAAAVQARSAKPAVEAVRASDLYTHVDASNPAGTLKTMQALTDKLGTAGAEAAQQAPGAREALPMQLCSSPEAGKEESLLWGPDHMVSLLTQDPANVSLQLELHALSAGQPVSLPLARILLTVPKTSQSSPTADVHSSSTVQDGIPLQACNLPGTTCSMELCLWQLGAYLERLLRSIPPEDAGVGVSSSLQDPKSMLSQVSWQDFSTSQKLGRSVGLKDADTASVTILEALVDDLLMKQIAIERITRLQDTSEARSEIMGWRVADAEQRSKTLLQENQRLRQLLHEDKEAQRSPPVLEISPNLSREQLVERTETALAAYSRERRRNTELVHRLQQMHSEQVDVLEMKKRYQELQTAHMELGRAMADPSSNASKMAKYRATVKTQEEVIANLELLLSQSMVKAKALPTLEAKHKAALAELDSIKRGPLIELDALRKGPLLELDWLRKERQNARPPPPQGMALSEVHELRKEHARQIHDLRAKQADLEERMAEAAERNELLEQEKERMRGKAEASREELVFTIKRYAEEISALKWKLAEKDAQLMGGFGAATAIGAHTPPWMAHTRASPLATPPATFHAQPLSSTMSGGLPFVQIPTYSPTTSSHASLQPTPTRTPKPLSPPIPPPQHTLTSQHPSPPQTQHSRHSSHSNTPSRSSLPGSPLHQNSLSNAPQQQIHPQPQVPSGMPRQAPLQQQYQQQQQNRLSNGSMHMQQQPLQPMRTSNSNTSLQHQHPQQHPQQPLQPLRASNGSAHVNPQQHLQQQLQQRASSADASPQVPTSPIVGAERSAVSASSRPLEPMREKLPSLQRQGAGLAGAPGMNGVGPGRGIPVGPGVQGGTGQMPPAMGQMLQAAWPRRDSPGSRV